MTDEWNVRYLIFSDTTTTTLIQPTTHQYTLYEYSIAFPIYALLFTIACFFFTYKFEYTKTRTANASTITIQPIAAIGTCFFAMIFWGMSAYTTINIKHIGNFGVSRSPYYIELGNPEFTYLFAGLSFICMLILIFLTQYFLRSQWKK